MTDSSFEKWLGKFDIKIDLSTKIRMRTAFEAGITAGLEQPALISVPVPPSCNYVERSLWDIAIDQYRHAIRASIPGGVKK